MKYLTTADLADIDAALRAAESGRNSLATVPSVPLRSLLYELDALQQDYKTVRTALAQLYAECSPLPMEWRATVPPSPASMDAAKVALDTTQEAQP